MSTQRSRALRLTSTVACSASLALVALWALTAATNTSHHGLLIVLATATGVSWIVWGVRRLEAALPRAVELGRQLERQRQENPVTLLDARRAGPVRYRRT